jgi:arylsulfatase A-like enzyme
MNFIIIVSDTLRRDHLGCYDNKWISTPNIDSFAYQSIIFDCAYSASFPTVPHRRDLFTGCFTATYTGWAPLSSQEITLSEILGSNDYISMMVCDCPHILENGYHYDRGFSGFEWIRGQESDRWKTYPQVPKYTCNPTKIRDAQIMQKCHKSNILDRQYESDTFVARTMNKSCQWLEENYKQEKFLLYVDTFDPHEPWDAPQWYVDMYDPDYKGEVVDYPLYSHIDFLTPEELQHCRALYAAEVTLVDRWIGKLLTKITDLGLLKNTLVILTTDHGFLHGEHNIIGKALISPHKWHYIPLYEEINHIPLIIHYPNATPRRTQAIVQPPDITPTLIDISETNDPGTLHGKPITDVLRGKTNQHRNFAISMPYLEIDNCPITIVKNHWTTILYPRKTTGKKIVDKAIDGFEKIQDPFQAMNKDILFNIADDPSQMHDVQAQHPNIVQELRDNLIKYLKEIGTNQELIKRWT